MKKINLIVMLLLTFIVTAQENEQKVILITLDGLRWQELFTGADEELVTNKEYVHDAKALKETFWAESPEERRAKLLPFIWSTAATKGQVYGNRNLGSNVNLTNTMWFSYPGYSEILTGKADDKNIHSNDKIYNPNITILETINNEPEYNGKVAAFGSWDVFPFIINDKRSDIPVNAGFRVAKGKELTNREVFLNELQSEIPSPWGSVRLDAFTHHYAKEYMQKEHPKMVYIAYGETDDFAHDGDYEAYLKSAHTTDSFIKDLWEFIESDQFYKDQTTIIITTDHGRGTQPIDAWRNHGSEVKGADEVWLIALGARVQSKGEIKNNEQLYTNQVAPTILELFKINSSNKLSKHLKF